MSSDAYRALQEQIDSLILAQDSLLSSVPDTREELAMDKEELIRLMNAENRTHLDGLDVKTRTRKEVNVRRVLEAMEGDLDNLMIVANVTQKSLETFWRDNPQYKRELRQCIEEKDTVVTDISLPDSTTDL